MDFSALRQELLNDPVPLGYSGMTNAQASAKLNALDTGRTRKRKNISGSEIWVALNTLDLVALPASPTAAQLSQERRDLAWLTGLAPLSNIQLLNEDGSNTQVRTMLERIIASNGNGTRARLLALSLETISRAVELGLGTVTEGDVKLAREKDGGW